jgi:hypothetical protein
MWTSIPARAASRETLPTIEPPPISSGQRLRWLVLLLMRVATSSASADSAAEFTGMRIR